MAFPANQLDMELDICVRGGLDIDASINRVPLLFHLLNCSVPSEGPWITITDLLAGEAETDAFVDQFAPLYVDARVAVMEKGYMSISVFNADTKPEYRGPRHTTKRALSGGNPGGVRVCRDFTFSQAMSSIHRFHPRCIIWECAKKAALDQLLRTIVHVVTGAQRTENIILIVETNVMDAVRDYVVRAFGDLDPFKGPDKVIVASKAQLHQLHAARGGSAPPTVNPAAQSAPHPVNAEPPAVVPGPSSDVSTAGSIVAMPADRDASETNIMGERSDDDMDEEGAPLTSVICPSCSQSSDTNMDQ